MKPTTAFFLFLVTLPLAGCASDRYSPANVKRLYPLATNASQISSWVTAQRVRCVNVTATAAAAPAPAADPRIRPTYAQRCSAEFPRALLERNVEAACSVSFNIDSSGVPLATSSICNLGGASADESDQVMGMYVALAKHVATSQRFSPLADERDGAVRNRLVQRIRFDLSPSRGYSPPYPTASAEVRLDQPKPLTLD